MSGPGNRRAARGRRRVLGVAALMLMLATTLGAALTIGMTPSADAQELTAPADRVTVVTTEIEPFVFREGDRPSGFYWEIWEDVAAELGVSFDVIWVETFDELVEKVEQGRADVAVAPLAPTAEREARLDFSSAVITSGPQLGVHERLETSVSLLRAFIGSRLLRLLIGAVAGLVILGHMIWLVERHDDDNDFHPGYLRGVWDGVWWAAATVTTVGYGDKAPTSTRGRLIAMVAMLASLFLVGAFVSEVSRDIAAQQNQQGITTLSDLGGRQVAVVDGSTFGDYVRAQGVATIEFPAQADAFDAVQSGTADVVLASPFALASLGAEHGVSATGSVLFEEFETYGLAQGSAWREPINAVLADLHSSGSVQATIDRWLD